VRPNFFVPQMQDFVHEKKWLNLRPEAVVACRSHPNRTC
jgi:hypothetical protein